MNRKISKKHLELIELLKRDDRRIVLMKGKNPHCFTNADNEYEISLLTLIKLEEWGILEKCYEDSLANHYKLTDFGKFCNKETEIQKL